MNIAKVYDDWHKAKCALYIYGDVNRGHIKELNYQNMQVNLLNGSKVKFLVISELSDVYKTSGLTFSLVDLDYSSAFDPEVVSFLMSRIRCVEMMGG